jgi:hypothetical protein
MAEGDGTIYNIFKSDILEKFHDIGTGGDTIQTTLHTGYTPNIDTHVIWTTAGVSSTEYGTASGYTAGGQALAGQAVTVNTSSDRAEYDGTDETWTSLGALSPATPSDAIHWNNTPAAPLDPLMAYWELGSTATNGGDYTLQWGANGLILLT